MAGFESPKNTASFEDSIPTPKFGDGFDDGRITAKKVADEAGRVFKYFYEKLEKYNPGIDALNEKILNQERELKNARTDSAKSLAIFVAFFTFVSISFSILPRISHPLVLIGILLVLLGSLTFFVLLLAWILDVQKEKWFTVKQMVIGVLALLLLGGGVTSSYLGYRDMERSDFYSQEEVNTLLNGQKAELESRIRENKEYVNEVLSRFKVCVALRGVSRCLAE